jgi:NADH-quinone oxidoreductase subunit G
MVRIVIDGEEYEVAEGRTILQAIDDLGLLMNGIDIPHYCWHPKLSIDGSCRLCQVEIEGLPKLQIACNTPVRDGMVVRTQVERVEEARRGVMELLLLNHPLDCPICDQAGECKLQDYAFDYGVAASRTDMPRRPAKKAQRLGPHIVFDQERCILCRRCVRFCREISKTGELGVLQRGEQSLLELFPGTELDNAYSMNTADVCPVGALTTEDMRFRIRVWFLDDVRSVCNQCARGCNVYAGRSNNKVYRYVPRRNDAVNDTWMCDFGRLSYKTLMEGRLAQPRAAGEDVGYDRALEVAAQALRSAHDTGARIVGVASPFAANEDLFTLSRLLCALEAPPAYFSVPRGPGDDLLLREERCPNAEGARALGMTELADGEGAGSAALAIVLGHTTSAAALAGASRILWIDTHEVQELLARAHVVLPARTHAEYDGSFTNGDRRVQAFQAFLEPRFEAWAPGDVLSQVARAAGLGFEKVYDPRAVSRELCASVPAFAGTELDALGPQGRTLS